MDICWARPVSPRPWALACPVLPGSQPVLGSGLWQRLYMGMTDRGAWCLKKHGQGTDRHDVLGPEPLGVSLEEALGTHPGYKVADGEALSRRGSGVIFPRQGHLGPLQEQRGKSHRGSLPQRKGGVVGEKILHDAC